MMNEEQLTPASIYMVRDDPGGESYTRLVCPHGVVVDRYHSSTACSYHGCNGRLIQMAAVLGICPAGQPGERRGGKT